jgi:menaquinone-dependent protoporphyrinogen oxidase
MRATSGSIERGRFLRHAGLGLTIGYAVLAAVFIAGESVRESAVWAAPLLVLAAIAWYRPATATPVLAVASAVVLALSGWFAIAPDAWRSFENGVGPVRALAAFVVAVPLGLLGRSRPGPAGVLLLAVGLGPVALADLAGIVPIFAVTSLSVISAPPVVVGCLYVLSAARAAARPTAFAEEQVSDVNRILVAYATKHGSTRQVADAVATVALASGAAVEIVPAASVRQPIAGRDLVVLGAPIYSGRWHHHAHRFLERHRRELAGVPVAVFGMGPRRDEEEAWERCRAQLDRALDKHPWLVPVEVGVFGGVDPVKRGRPGRDLRDWAEIGTWTRKVIALLDR